MGLISSAARAALRDKPAHTFVAKWPCLWERVSLRGLLSIQQPGLVTRNHQGASAPLSESVGVFLCAAVSFYGGCA